MAKYFRKSPKRPTIRPERLFAEQCGGMVVAGVDEAGRGPLAGPVVAGAVIFAFSNPRPIGLRDSKRLSEKQREALFPKIQKMALSWGIGVATAQEIDLYNILEATRLAAQRAIAALDPQPGALVTDALTIPKDPRPQLPIVKGDAHSASIAAASILAKVTRDRLMDAYHAQFPEYGWDRNRGYPTEEHYAALAQHGPTSLHRLSFSGVGFFDTALRHSPLCVGFRARLEGLGPAGTDAADTWRAEVLSARDILPPLDFQQLAASRPDLLQPPGTQP